MIEIPEARVIAKDLRKMILGKRIVDLRFGNKPHKFAFFHGDKETYKEAVYNKAVTEIVDRSFYVEIVIEDYTLTMRDGTIIRYHDDFTSVPDNYQFLIEFEDDCYLSVTIAMYGFIGLFKTGTMDNEYYLKDINGISPLDDKFTLTYFKSLLDERTMKLSTKAFIATEQRFPGIGNGITQDILLNAQLHPKTKMKFLTEKEIEILYQKIISTINEMMEQNGRNTEKDIYGNKGNYLTKLSKNTYGKGCPKCSGEIIKENYLGGAIYYCSSCQIEKKK